MVFYEGAGEDRRESTERASVRPPEIEPPQVVPSQNLAPYTPQRTAMPRNFDYIRWSQDPANELEQFTLHLKGKRIIVQTDPSGQPAYFLEQYAPPLLTEEGVNGLMVTIQPLTSKIGVLGNIDEKRLAKECLNLGKQLNFVMGVNAKPWGVKPTKHGWIVSQAVRIIHMSLSRSLDAGEAIRVSGQNQRVEQIMTQTSQPSQGMVSSLKSKLL